MDAPKEYPISPLAELFPEMGGEDYGGLVASIREEGLIDPITIWLGHVLDGRHRYRACAEAGVEPRFTVLEDEADPVSYMLARNQVRRHLDDSQRAVVAYKLSAGPTQDEGGANLHNGLNQKQASERLGVSRRSLNYAGKVLSPTSTADPAVRLAVEQGLVKVSDATSIVTRPAEVQRQALDRVLSHQSKTLMAAVKRIEAENARREEEEAGESIRARPIVETAVFHHSAVSVLKEHVPEASVDAIITHPQAMTEALPLLSGLADFAAHALKRGGVLVVMADALLLPQMIEHLKHDKVRWLCEFDLWYDRPGRERYPLRVRFHRTPLLIYGKSRFQLDGGDDVIRVPDLDKAARGPGRQHPAELAMSLIVRRFARRGQVVCDPFVLGRGGAAVGAMRHGCNFIGADQDSSCIDRTQSILARAEAEFLS